MEEDLRDEKKIEKQKKHNLRKILYPLTLIVIFIIGVLIYGFSVITIVMLPFLLVGVIFLFSIGFAQDLYKKLEKNDTGIKENAKDSTMNNVYYKISLTICEISSIINLFFSSYVAGCFLIGLFASRYWIMIFPTLLVIANLVFAIVSRIGLKRQKTYGMIFGMLASILYIYYVSGMILSSYISIFIKILFVLLYAIYIIPYIICFIQLRKNKEI